MRLSGSFVTPVVCDRSNYLRQQIPLHRCIKLDEGAMPMILPLEAKRWNRFVALLASAFFFLCLPIGTNDEFDVRHRIDRCPDERKTRVKHATTYSCMGGFVKCS